MGKKSSTAVLLLQPCFKVCKEMYLEGCILTGVCTPAVKCSYLCIFLFISCIPAYLNPVQNCLKRILWADFPYANILSWKNVHSLIPGLQSQENRADRGKKKKRRGAQLISEGGHKGLLKGKEAIL